MKITQIKGCVTAKVVNMYFLCSVQMLVLSLRERTVSQPHSYISLEETFQCWDLNLRQVGQDEGEIFQFSLFVVDCLLSQLAELLGSEIVSEGVVDDDVPQVGEGGGEQGRLEGGQTDALELQSLQTVAASQSSHHGLHLELRDLHLDQSETGEPGQAGGKEGRRDPQD